MAETNKAPLSGIKVLDFTHNLPGPYATFMLASLGARVIKVEPPKGDPARHIEPFFSMINRGKESIVLDLREERSRPALEALIRWADVIVEGFRPEVMTRLGADEATARALNPEVVYCSVTAFGQTGPKRDDPGHDLNVQAMTGLCWLERDREERPRATVVPAADLSTSLAAVASICAALYDRERGARGSTLDVSMTDTLASWVSLWGGGVDLTARARGSLAREVGLAAALIGRVARPLFARLQREKLYSLPQYNLYRARDGRWLSIGIVDERHFWERMCRVLGVPWLGAATMSVQTLAGPLLKRLIAFRVARFPAAELVERLEEADVPATLVRRQDEIEEEPQLVTRGLFDDHGWVGSPLAGSTSVHGEAPMLGEHTKCIADELGFTVFVQLPRNW